MENFRYTGYKSNFLCHRLSICPKAKPIAQGKRKLNEERRKAVEEETNRLMKANFIREIRYTTCLANVVMVKRLMVSGECALIIPTSSKVARIFISAAKYR